MTKTAIATDDNPYHQLFEALIRYQWKRVEQELDRRSSQMTAEFVVRRVYKVRLNNHDVERIGKRLAELIDWEFSLTELLDACTRQMDVELDKDNRMMSRLYLIHDKDSAIPYYWVAKEIVRLRGFKPIDEITFTAEESDVEVD